MNTLNNAAHAVKKQHGASGGRIQISSRMLEGMVHITITDNGTGMDQRTLGRIFEPFFTTKAVGEGTGLGLSIVQGIIEKHHGQITVQSETGVGSSFTFKLPVRQDAQAAKRA
jgi:signal transduction histidine kinase